MESDEQNLDKQKLKQNFTVFNRDGFSRVYVASRKSYRGFNSIVVSERSKHAKWNVYFSPEWCIEQMCHLTLVLEIRSYISHAPYALKYLICLRDAAAALFY